MIQNGGIKIDSVKIIDVDLQVKIIDGLVIQVGKRKFVRLERFCFEN
jgi:tyrosyl-tRNA synthetase